MDNFFSREPMLEMFIFETLQLIEQLEQNVLSCETSNQLDSSSINEIFRIMHTIKGSAAMMMFDNIAGLAHSMEDLFYFLREDKPQGIDYSKSFDIVLESSDFIKKLIAKLQNGQAADEKADTLINKIEQYLLLLKGGPADSESLTARTDNEQQFYITAAQASPGEIPGRFHVLAFFKPGCAMENLRAFNIVHKLNDLADSIEYYPADIIENDNSAEQIRQQGFEVIFRTAHQREELEVFFKNADLVQEIELKEIEEDSDLGPHFTVQRPVGLEDVGEEIPTRPSNFSDEGFKSPAPRQSMVSVNVNKLDHLMDLVGELVISEAMVTLNPDLTALANLDNFHKAARQHRKIINELQDVVMSIRMVPLAPTFQKMRRIVRDMSKKLNKEVELEIIGEETEVDKNIIEHLSDPLMHLIRNAIDHGIESPPERIRQGKDIKGKIRLEAKNEGGDVWIIVKDDGAGLNKEKILQRVREMGLSTKSELDLTEREIFSFILLPGFSTRDEVSEFSGRGVGMDVVVQNIESVGGKVLVDSNVGNGTATTLKIPLTLAIIDGMGIKVGDSIFIIPIKSIRESFWAREEDITHDPDGNEMIMVRGDCLPILRLQQRFNIQSPVDKIEDGIIIIVENDSQQLCLFADALLGEQQVVVKALPGYLKRINGVSGCTLLGDGRASLILDVAGLINY
ncbi:MAG TPA: chemotaxis protein CheA [Syntrophomonadaceae bacterium]|nr:chemotaxis protein CheA [Syntrophomonadaceae bacterium]